MIKYKYTQIFNAVILSRNSNSLHLPQIFYANLLKNFKLLVLRKGFGLFVSMLL